MRQWIEGIGLALLAGALLVGCTTGPKEEQGAASVQQAIMEAREAAESMATATTQGNLVALQPAYERFAEVIGQVLGPVSLEDAQVAARMANANTTIQDLLSKPQLEIGQIERELAVLRTALDDSVTTMGKALAPQERFTVVAKEYRFDPKTIRVKKGSRVTIRLENRGTMPHEFEIDELDFELGPIEPGKFIEGSFMADKAGSFAYECHVDGHDKKGMRGLLVVEE